MALENQLAVVTFLSFTQFGQAVSNTFHITKGPGGSPPDLATLQGLADDLNAVFSDDYRSVLDEDSIFQQITVKQVADPTDPEPVAAALHTSGLAGTREITGELSPQSLCAVIRFRTAIASKRFRGHLFAPPCFQATDQNGDKFNVSTNYIGHLNNLASTFEAGSAGGDGWTGDTLSDWELCIFSKAAALESQPSVSPVTAVTVPLDVHWLRSRERGAS